MDFDAALAQLRRKFAAAAPLAPDPDGQVRLAFRGGLELRLVPAGRGRVVAQVELAALPADEKARDGRLRALLARAVAMMKGCEEVLALDGERARPVLWRELDLPSLDPAGLEEALARLLDRAEWLAEDAAAVADARPPGPMMIFP